MDAVDQHALDDQARAIVARYKESLEPAADDVAANWRAIAAQAQVDDDRSDRRRAAWRAFGLGAVVATAAAAAALLLWVRPWQTASVDGVDAMDAAQYGNVGRQPAGLAEDRQPAAPTPARTRRAPTVVPTPPEPDVIVELEPEVAPEAEVEEARTPRRKKEPFEAPPVDPIEAIKLEAALVARARTALSGGKPGKALQLTRQHRKQFAGGAMQEEVAAIAVGAHCEVGPEARWRKALATFDRRYPGSPLRAHLRDDCF